MVAALAVAGIASFAVAAARFTQGQGVEHSPPPPRELQEYFCNPQIQAVQPVSSAFAMTGDWAYTCIGQGAQPVPPPPSETEKFPGQQNFCWNWMKHKGCKDVITKLNWKDAQAATAAAGLAPDAAYVPMVPVQNPTLCEDYNLGATVYAQPQETA